MTMRFPYLKFIWGRPDRSLERSDQLGHGRSWASRSSALGAPDPSTLLLDTGADDTVFPEQLASRLGIDLVHSRGRNRSRALAGQLITVRYASVRLRIADQQEQREWPALVAFAPLGHQDVLPMLGFAGFLQYFTATFYGDREEVELTVNSLYPGT